MMRLNTWGISAAVLATMVTSSIIYAKTRSSSSRRDGAGLDGESDAGTTNGLAQGTRGRRGRSGRRSAEFPGTVYVTDRGTHYHRDGCRAMRGHHRAVMLEEIMDEYTPCRLCHPEA